jgi:hypothetical protein
MIGNSRTAAMRTVSATSNSTCVNSSARVLILGEVPGLRRRDELVRAIDEGKDGGGGFVDGESIHRRAIGRKRLDSQRAKRSGFTATGVQAQLPVLVHHRRDTADEVPEVVGEIDVVAFLEPFPREISVAPVWDLLHEVQAQGIRPQSISRFERIDDRAEGFAHPLALEMHPAVTEHGFRKRRPALISIAGHTTQ